MRAEQGFTLVEVLVAASILFMVVATGMLSYQTALQGSHRAAKLLELTSVVEPFQQHIRKAIRDHVEVGGADELSGVTTLLSIHADWSATPIAGAPPTARYDPDLDVDTGYESRFFIYRVSLLVEHGSLAREYSYLELAWDGQVRRR